MFDDKLCWLCGFSYENTPKYNTFNYFREKLGKDSILDFSGGKMPLFHSMIDMKLNMSYLYLSKPSPEKSIRLILPFIE